MLDHTAQNQAAYDAGATGWRAYAPNNVRHRYLEKPAMERELPEDLTGKKVLCIGAGSGEELEAILARHPETIIATDISEKLLHIARRRYPEVTYKVMDMMSLDFPNNMFDLVYSSLAFHYTNDWDRLLTGIHRVMKPGGTLLFSTHHPGYWSKRPTGETYTNSREVKLTEHTATLPGGVGITYYNHSSTDSIIEALTHAGFRVEHAYAPSVVPLPHDTLPPPDRKKYKNLVRTNTETPLFWVVGAVAHVT